MLVVFSAIFVADTNVIFRYYFEALLKKLRNCILCIICMGLLFCSIRV